MPANDSQPCPYLPEVEEVLDFTVTRRHGADKGPAFYRDALRFSQSLWQQGDGLFIGTPESELHRAAELQFPESMRALRKLPIASIGRSIFAQGSSILERFGMQADLASIFDALAPRGIGSFDFGSPETLRVAIPAGNGLFTARALAKTYAALANGGEYGGVRLLSRATLRRATQRAPKTQHHAVVPFDMRWRLGYHGIATTRGFPGSAFGHFGFGGSGAWADPERNMSLALIVNSGIGTPFGDLRTARISGAALACVNARAGRDSSGLKSLFMPLGLI